MLAISMRRMAASARFIPRAARVLSTNTESSARAARAARKAKLEQANKASGKTMTSIGLGVLSAFGIVGYCAYDIRTNKDGSLAKMYRGSSLESVISWTYEQTFGRFREIYYPYDTKLLPDWPTAPCYGNPPPGTPAPPVLVLDLEKTLIGSEYDARYGWRHVKRPGLDQFLNRLSPYYEIVIFSENDIGAVLDLLAVIDPEGKCHKFGSSAAEARDGVMLKRLDYMNRDLGRIILVDDNPDAFQLFPRNTLQVKPFNDVADKADTILYDLVPLLQAFIHDDVKDFRDCIDDLGTNDAAEAAIEYQMRVSRRKNEENAKRNKGIGGLVRSRLTGGQAEVEPLESRSGVLSLSQIVGESPESFDSFSSLSGTGSGNGSSSAAPVEFKGYGGVTQSVGGDASKKQPVERKKGALFEWLDNAEKEKEEHEMRKREKMNEIYMKKMMEKQAQEEKEAAERARKAARV